MRGGVSARGMTIHHTAAVSVGAASRLAVLQLAQPGGSRSLSARCPVPPDSLAEGGEVGAILDQLAVQHGTAQQAQQGASGVSGQGWRARCGCGQSKVAAARVWPRGALPGDGRRMQHTHLGMEKIPQSPLPSAART